MEVKWIKICTDIFDDEKIALIDSMPDSDSILVIWFKLLCMAGKQNNGGVFMLNDKIAYNDEMLATIFRRPLNVVRLALSTFEKFGMVEIVDNVYTIPNWNKHQNLDKLEQEKEKTRKRVADFRQKQKLLAQPKNDENLCNAYCNVTVTECNNSCNGYSNVTVTECNATDKNKNKNKNEIREDKNRILYQQIIDLFHETCVSFSKITALSEKRKKMINARLNTYGIEKITEVFKKAESSDFLKGKNNRDWKANFDWIMNDSNFAKILDGNYDNKTSQPVPENKLYQDNFDHNFLEALTRKRKFQ